MKSKFLLAITIIFFSFQAIYSAGRIGGKVQDEDGLSLAGANVYIQALATGAATDQNGEFVILNVPEGSFELVVTYLGYSKETVNVTVQSNKTTYIDVTLKSGVVIGREVLVLGDGLKGQAKALNQQKNNANITNVVSSDQIGRFPDANVGDALKRIPAITVNYDQGEARFVNIRGTEPRLNSIMINGERVPSAEGEIRSVQVDLIPSDMIQSIEVSKAVTPEMDADAIGGSVNLVTRKAPNRLRLSGTLGSGYNFLSEKAMLSGSFVVGQRFSNNKLGLVLSGSYLDHELGSDNTEGEWDGEAGNYFPKEWDVRKYDIRRLRRSISAAFDYKFNPDHTIFVRGIYNHRNDWENRFRLRYKLDEPNANGVVEEAEIRRQTKGGIGNDENDNTRLEDQRTWRTSVSGDHILGGNIKMNWAASYSKASEERPNERYISWRIKDVPVGLNLSDSREPKFIENIDPGQFELKEITDERQFTEEKDFNTRLDLEIPLTIKGKNKNSLKFGGRYKQKDKERDNNFFEYEPLSGFDKFTDVASSDYSDSDYLAGDYLIGRFTTPEFLGSLDLNNSSLFEKKDTPAEYAADNYNASEKVLAGYVQLNQQLGEKLFLIAGVRIEKTDVDYNGNEFDEDNETIKPTSGTDDYTNFLPGVHLKYTANPNTILRFAWTNTIARPNYYDLVPYRNIAEDQEELAIGNPALDPTTSMNFDIMLENYYQTVGIISAGLFYKKIDDYIYIHNESDYADPVSGNTYDDFFQPRNGAEATLWGAEFAFQRRLDFLPGSLKNLNFYANYTYTNSSTENPQLDAQVGGNEDIELPGTAPHTLNAALNYEDAKFKLGISFNYSSPYLDPDALDLTPGLERYYDLVTYLDIIGSYAITSQFRIFFEANNLLNQPLRYYAGDSERTYQAEFYNRRFTAGVKFDL